MSGRGTVLRKMPILFTTRTEVVVASRTPHRTVRLPAFFSAKGPPSRPPQGNDHLPDDGAFLPLLGFHNIPVLFPFSLRPP